MYKLTQENYVIQGNIRFSVSDSPDYPNANPHYLAYKEWLAAGNTPEPADPIPSVDAAIAVRAKRDALIKETDFYVLPDYPNAPHGIAEYRQALRDITEQPGFPHDVTWPELAAVDAPE